APGDGTSQTTQVYAQQNQTTPSEGIGTGWFYSVLGGGMDQRPHTSDPRIPVAFDNTLQGPDDLPVPSIFNGNFDASIHPLLGRFPSFFYEIPGWSFHNGEGIQSFNLDSLNLQNLSPQGTPDDQKDYALRLGGKPQVPVAVAKAFVQGAAKVFTGAV